MLRYGRQSTIEELELCDTHFIDQSDLYLKKCNLNICAI